MSPSSLEVRDLQWRTSRRSAGNGACVEVAPANGKIAVRDSKNPGGIWLHYPASAWRNFVSGIKSE
jgi:uncharacterized protein DUF397